MAELLALDAALLRWISQLPRPELLDLCFIWLSRATGFPGTLWILLGVLAAGRSAARRRGLVRLVWALAAAILLTSFVFKPIFDRPRPFAVDIDVTLIGSEPGESAFPSGHATVAAAAAYALTLIAPGGRVVWWGLALLVGAARVYLGVHYPLDVLAGWLLGALIGLVVTGGVRCRDGPDA